MGLLLGAFLNLPNLYIATFYPHAIAQARSVPFPFFGGDKSIEVELALQSKDPVKNSNAAACSTV